MWDLPEPGVKPMSPALAGRFFITEPATRKAPPGEFLLCCFCFVDTLGIVPSYNKGTLLFGEVIHN